MGRKRKVYTDEFKQKMVLAYKNGDLASSDFAANNKISKSTFRKWVEASRKNESPKTQNDSLIENLKPIDVTKETKEIIVKTDTIKDKKIDIEINGITLTFSSKNLKLFLEVIQNG